MGDRVASGGNDGAVNGGTCGTTPSSRGNRRRQTPLLFEVSRWIPPAIASPRHSPTAVSQPPLWPITTLGNAEDARTYAVNSVTFTMDGRRRRPAEPITPYVYGTQRH